MKKYQPMNSSQTILVHHNKIGRPLLLPSLQPENKEAANTKEVTPNCGYKNHFSSRRRTEKNKDDISTRVALFGFKGGGGEGMEKKKKRLAIKQKLDPSSRL
ncbi:hypothetical protein CEXT_168061 [Caerostris extrusa]|uniref:Uncharacterized protein n=1 Tax=Caerostris extrusa TaxID=172846 RepID=A0AAV4N4E7_CAEEX|nr:hypothetical protein CEXT_168061 [Caerostris extrusa]